MSLLAYLLNSLWQVPLVCAAAWIAARLARRMGPRMEHRIWVIALFLEVLLPLCQFQMQSAWGWLLSFFGASAPGGEVSVRIGPATAAPSALRLPPELRTIVLIAYSASLLYFAGRLGWAFWRTLRMRRDAASLMLTEEIEQKIERFCSFFRIPRAAVRIAASPAAPGPVAVGVKQRTLLLPPQFIERASAEDLDTVFAHEFAHLQRQDFARNLLYSVIALPVAWHPLLWLTRSRLVESREMVCDSMAAEAVQSRENYARSLLRLASMLLLNQNGSRPIHAIGIFDANALERRIMNLTQKHFELRGIRRLVIGAVCGAIALGTCASALAFHIAADTQQKGAPTQPPTRLHVAPGVMEGNLIHHDVPAYPPEAKKAKIQGTVILAAHIGKDGAPESLHVKSGPAILQQSAMDAVRQWRWKPYLLNGNPVEVDTDIKVIYSLGK